MYKNRHDRIWDAAFFRAGPRTSPVDNLHEYGSYSPKGSYTDQEIRQRQSSFTFSATELVELFNLSEKTLPCIVILSLLNRRIYVLSSIGRDQDFSLYRFIQAVLDQAPRNSKILRNTGDEINTAIKQKNDIEHKMKYIPMRIEKYDDKISHVTQRSKRQIQYACRCLVQLSEEHIEYRKESLTISAQLQSDYFPTEEIRHQWRSFIKKLRFGKCTNTYLCSQLISVLENIVNKYMPETLHPSHAAQQKVRFYQERLRDLNELSGLLAAQQIEITAKIERLKKYRDEVELETATKFCDAVLAAAGISSDNKPILLQQPSFMQDWQSFLITYNPSNHP